MGLHTLKLSLQPLRHMYRSDHHIFWKSVTPGDIFHGNSTMILVHGNIQQNSNGVTASRRNLHMTTSHRILQYFDGFINYTQILIFPG